MELKQFFTVLARRWWLIVIPVAIAAAFVVIERVNNRAPLGAYTTSIRYTAMQSMEAIPRTEGDYQDIWLASTLTVDAFTDWVRGSQFAAEVIEAAATRGLTMQPGALGIAADNERVQGQITLTWASASELETIRDAAVEVLQTRSGDYFAQLGGVPASVSLLDQSAIIPAPPPLTDRFAPFLRVGLGLLAGLGLALLAHFLDPVVRERGEIEALGLPILAHIPRR